MGVEPDEVNPLYEMTLELLDECHLGGHSTRELLTADERLIKLFRVAIRFAPAELDFSVVEGHREKLAQNLAFDRGTSKLRWPKSRHNKRPSLAIDARPYPRPQSSAEDWRYWRLRGFIETVARMVGVRLRPVIVWDPGHYAIDEVEAE